ncbi:MAG TPA: hypothetical protein DET40_17955 [Lentisphaeria bacterium]|nr:MAG: hypothetical protein A2X45_02060 [Lentisphaerae bacterium GWF2_50_93]HCE45427.1 hypothetical protein [Lentisphaeria bacterium]
MRFRNAAVCVFSALIGIIALAAYANSNVGWKELFQFDGKAGEKILPKGWEIRTKIGTAASEFYLVKDEKDNMSCLHMESDKSSGSVICNPEKVNLKDTPMIRWKWRVKALPQGGDGREGGKDDQAIGIYVGTGSLLSKKSVSYRWDTETPKGSEGNCSYVAGTLKIKWFTLRNKEDALGEWFVEERNVAEDFKNAWGYYPDEIYISVSSNSQYTASKASADLNWIELNPIAVETKK